MLFFISICLTFNTLKTMYVLTMTSYFEAKPEIGTSAITGSLEHLNQQMTRLYFNLKRTGYKISNASYGFIVAKNIKRKEIFFAQITTAFERTIPLSKNQLLNL